MAGQKSFNETLSALRYGTLIDDLTEEMNNLTTQCAETGRPGSLTITLQLKPGKGGQIEVFDDIKVKLPKEEKGSSIFFVTPEGNLTRNNPRQPELDGLRAVENQPGELRRVNV